MRLGPLRVKSWDPGAKKIKKPYAGAKRGDYRGRRRASHPRIAHGLQYPKLEPNGATTREGEELAIQGSHMHCSTRCPAWSYWLKKWSES